MKLMPEQKALIEYGKALGRLEEFRSDHWSWCCVNRLDRRHSWRTEDGFDCETKDIVNQHAKLIRDAWQKRAACRAWVSMEDRYCNNCMHFKLPESNSLCAECCQWADPVKWEPRKEGM